MNLILDDPATLTPEKLFSLPSSAVGPSPSSERQGVGLHSYSSLPSKPAPKSKILYDSEKSRSSRQTQPWECIPNLSFKNYRHKDSRQESNNMDCISFKLSTPKEPLGRNGPGKTPRTGTEKSRHTTEFLPSFTFGSRDMMLREAETGGPSLNGSGKFEVGEIDSMVNIFFENSVSSKSRREARVKRKAKLSFRKKLEKKIFKAKAKSIFKNQLMQKFGVRRKMEDHSPSPGYGQAKKFFKPLMPKKKFSQSKLKKIDFGLNFNPKTSPSKNSALNISLPCTNSSKPLKSKTKKPKNFNFNKGFRIQPETHEQKKINNIIHDLNTSRTPATFIDYSCLNSPLNMPSFTPVSPEPHSPKHFSNEDIAPATKGKEIRLNTLNFSFNPKLGCKGKTQPSISTMHEREIDNFQNCDEGGLKIGEHTSIFENKILSTGNLETEDDSNKASQPGDSHSPDFFAKGLAINFNVLN